ncbi:hypothetical protein [Paraburkholderia strydomiana]|uniref:hypothetical protein n=1 Tax=Paraburkholderia strydomiana TaxID=1245417 RepID=UPI0038BB2A01
MKRILKIPLICAAGLGAVVLLAAGRWVLLATHAELQPYADIADFCLKTLSAAAVLIGGGWAMYKYIISGSTSWMNNIALDTEVLPYQDDLRLLVIHVRSVNPRTSKFEFNEHNATFKLDIRQLPSDRAARTIFDEEEGQLFASIDLLKGTGGYEMLPGGTMDDMRTVILPVGTTVSMTAELRIRRWCQRESDFISTSSVVRIDQHDHGENVAPKGPMRGRWDFDPGVRPSRKPRGVN